MKLAQLLTGIVDTQEEVEIKRLTLDSRQDLTHGLFVAFPGECVDGRDYIPQAIQKGAVAIIYEAQGAHGDWLKQAMVPMVAIDNMQQHLSNIASRLYGQPSKLMRIIGITGTNGKSSVAYMLAQALHYLGKDAAMIGTIGVGRPDQLQPSSLTTPDAIAVQEILHRLLMSGVEVVCMEVSSHGLEQGRVAAVEFEQAVWTNLSQDHLDYHGDMQTYGAVKRRLFEWANLRLSVINLDDSFGQSMIKDINHTVLSYGLASSDVQISEVRATESGLSLVLTYLEESLQINTLLIGAFNASNIAAVVGVLLGMDFSLAQSMAAVKQSTAPAGRAELLEKGTRQVSVVVDYAHTPDALEQVLISLRAHCQGQLTVVMGCGGDRDQTKRPLMGRIAEQQADRVILTDDNPRSEAPEEVIAGIVSGMSMQPMIIHDRREAINTAIKTSHAHDWVLIAGKGHETTQTYADKVLELNDRLVATACLEWVA